MYVVRVAEQFPPFPGGLAPGLLALSLAQHRRGHELTVVTPNARTSGADPDELPFRVLRVKCRSLVHFGWRVARLLRDLGKRPDIIHCHGPAAAPILFRKRKGDPPVVLTLHSVRKYQYGLFRDLGQLVESFARCIGSPARNPPRHYGSWSPRVIWELMLERYMCQHADHLALVATYFGQQVGEYYGVPSDRCTVAYNGSDFRRPSSTCARAVKASLGLHKDDSVILYVGRLDWVKRAHLLVQALPAVLERDEHARLLLVGDGDQRPDLEFLITKMGLEGCVSILGWVQHGELHDIYQCAECLCLPSIWEGLSKVVLEAMSLGVPVVASDIPGNREVLQSGRTGFLVERPDPACWASTLCEVLANPGEADARARQAVACVEEKYRWPHVAERLDGVYKMLVESK